jgi:glycosyltransferase involved in cell wall biosynthesis
LALLVELLMLKRAAPSRQGDVVLICGPWPSRRHSVFTIIQGLIGALHRSDRAVCYLCDAYPLTRELGPDAVCFLDFPPGDPFEWRSAFARKRLYPSLTALLKEDCASHGSLLGRVAVVHLHLDRLVLASGHPENSKAYDRTLADHIELRTGRRPVLVRTRQDDMQGTLDRLMRLTGIDYVALDRDGREKLLRGEIDIGPLVRDQVRRNRDLLHSWGWNDDWLVEATDHVWWLVHQLYRWRHEADHFDAVVCVTGLDAEQNRDWLAGEGAANITHVHNGIDFSPKDRRRVDRLLHDFHHRRGLSCFRGGGEARERIAFSKEDRKIVFVGRIVTAKGIRELVESARNLYHSGRRNIRLIVVGDCPPEARRDLASIDPTSAGHYLLFTGQVNDLDALATLFAFGDVTAIPSHYDPMPLVGIETYLMGTPCVVTEGTGAAEAYLERPRRHGVDMALPVRRRHAQGPARFHGVDVDSLAVQLAFLLDNPLAAWRMAQDGERFVREHYSSDRMGRTYLRLYDLLLDGGQAARLHG